MTRSRSASSQRWLRRQQTDPWVARARAEGFRARSVYKLAEIDHRFQVLRRGLAVLDLGAAPGSWSQYAARRGCRVVAVDRLPMEPIPGVEIVAGDFLEEETQARIRACFPAGVDVILSDLAPETTGRRTVDRLRSEAAGEEILAFARTVLKPGGHLLLKLLKGAEAEIAARARPLFAKIRFLRPAATRKESSETYLLATGFRSSSAAGESGGAGKD
ncbi:Ribosomal RNA large subunit methyltransferase E [bacterium HR40]|nr:Ribosomal RNA large subunit methyltransferase E [bacterium HR40]